MHEEVADHLERDAEVTTTVEASGRISGSGLRRSGVNLELVMTAGCPPRGGMHKGAEPSCGGSRQHRCVPAVFAGAQRASAWGEPARPAFPGGETGKGRLTSLLPQAQKGLTFNMNAKDPATNRGVL